jgi:hypothetical protein
MTAAVKKGVGKKSVQNTSYSSRKTVFPLFRNSRGPKNTEKYGLVSFGKSSEKRKTDGISTHFHEYEKYEKAHIEKIKTRREISAESQLCS